MVNDRFKDWKQPEIKNGELTKYNWLVKNKEKLKLGCKTDIGAFTYINAKHGVVIGRNVQIGSHCSIYTVSTIDNKMGKVTIFLFYFSVIKSISLLLNFPKKILYFLLLSSKKQGLLEHSKYLLL